MTSPDPRPEFEPPSREQRERAAAARVAGLMKPGQGEGHWRKLLLLEGVESDRVEAVLEMTRREHSLQVARRQAPLRPLAWGLIGFGLGGVLALPLMLIFDRRVSTIVWGVAFVVAGLFLIGRGVALRRSLQAESDVGFDLEKKTGLFGQHRSASARLDETRERARRRSGKGD